MLERRSQLGKQAIGYTSHSGSMDGLFVKQGGREWRREG